jgi:diacylglycerol kinase
MLARQQNFRLELVAAIGVIAVAIALGLNRFEFVALLAMIVLVIFTEIVNSAFEEMLDCVSLEFNQKFGYVKNIMAALVLVVAIGAAVVGVIIFYPYVITAIDPTI